ncbi:hypothetical protein L1887_03174 [Cichorium endivia]|nr:hypothetical protein L1887_03174 [Cichorium endivia]
MESSKDVNNNSNNNNKSPLNTPLKRESLDASTSGGVAKNDVKCSLLANGDIVQETTGNNNLKRKTGRPTKLPSQSPNGSLEVEERSKGLLLLKEHEINRAGVKLSNGILRRTASEFTNEMNFVSVCQRKWR